MRVFMYNQMLCFRPHTPEELETLTKFCDSLDPKSLVFGEEGYLEDRPVRFPRSEKRGDVNGPGDVFRRSTVLSRTASLDRTPPRPLSDLSRERASSARPRPEMENREYPATAACLQL